jgi:low temperature requirement protein LtrA
MHETETRRHWVVPMKPRSPHEAHRAATPLELLFDLVFVVAVAQASSKLHHGIAEGHIVETLVTFVMVFFGVWWAWMGFTWFASAYDTDDIPYRVLVFVQMTGALIVASGVERVFSHQDLSVTVVGYVVMRVASTIQWLRAAQADPEHRPAALRYAGGTFLAQVAWIILVFLPKPVLIPGFFTLVVVELLVPIWAERVSPTPWHAHHIRERYGLFTLIVLGESILSTSSAIQSSIDAGTMDGNLIGAISGGLLIIYSMWWLYFYQPARQIMASLRVAFIWSYGHWLIFAATAALGAGLAVMIDQATHHAEISATGAAMAVAIPTALFVLSLWVLQEHAQKENLLDLLPHPIIAGLILVVPLLGQSVLVIGILMVILVAIRVMRRMA